MVEELARPMGSQLLTCDVDRISTCWPAAVSCTQLLQAANVRNNTEVERTLNMVAIL
jgi:hypothetical protein